jgi:uncharacterized protein YjbI with pentapeptide repeats
MRIENEKHRLNVRHADLSGSHFDDGSLFGDMSGRAFEDLNMSVWRVRDVNLAGLKIEKANLVGASIVEGRLEAAPIDGIAVADLLAYWRVGHGARSA